MDLSLYPTIIASRDLAYRFPKQLFVSLHHLVLNHVTDLPIERDKHNGLLTINFAVYIPKVDDFFAFSVSSLIGTSLVAWLPNYLMIRPIPTTRCLLKCCKY